MAYKCHNSSLLWAVSHLPRTGKAATGPATAGGHAGPRAARNLLVNRTQVRLGGRLRGSNFLVAVRALLLRVAAATAAAAAFYKAWRQCGGDAAAGEGGRRRRRFAGGALTRLIFRNFVVGRHYRNRFAAFR
jgi:hypothetical protein